MNKLQFSSPLKPYIERFLEFKEAEGQYIGKLSYILREFDDFACEYGLNEPIIKKDLIDAWSKTRSTDGPHRLYYKYSIWSQLSKYLCRNGRPCYIPRMPPCPPKNSFVPYIFSEEQIKLIFRVSDESIVVDKNMKTNLFAIPALLRLLYSTGLRINEALSLENRDVYLSERYILVRKTKNKSEKLVALSESMVITLQQYELYKSKIPVPGILNDNHYYFIQPCGLPIRSESVYSRFRKILNKCGIPFIGRNKGPRVHDLRHTYAVHALMQMSRNGMDLYTSLPILSVALGHKSVSATERYVRLTAAAYSDVLEKNSETTSRIYFNLNDYDYQN